MITTGSWRCDWLDESKAPARTRRPTEGHPVCTSTNVFERSASAPRKRSEKDSGAFAQAAVQVAAEYPEKPVGCLARSGPVRPHCRLSADGGLPGLQPARDDHR